MISCSSTLASSAPATSAKVSLGVSPVRSLAFDFPKEKARFPARLQLAEEEDPERDDGQRREDVQEEGREPAPRLLGFDGDAGGLQAGLELLVVRERQHDHEALGRARILKDGRAEVALEALAIVDGDARNIAGVELPEERGVGKLLRRVPLAVHRIVERQREQPDEQPEREVLAQAGPVGPLRARGMRSAMPQSRSTM